MHSILCAPLLGSQQITHENSYQVLHPALTQAGMDEFLQTTLPLQTRLLRGVIVHLALHQLWRVRSRVEVCKLLTLDTWVIIKFARCSHAWSIPPDFTRQGSLAAICDPMDKQKTRRIKILCRHKSSPNNLPSTCPVIPCSYLPQDAGGALPQIVNCSRLKLFQPHPVSLSTIQVGE